MVRDRGFLVLGQRQAGARQPEVCWDKKDRRFAGIASSAGRIPRMRANVRSSKETITAMISRSGSSQRQAERNRLKKQLSQPEYVGRIDCSDNLCDPVFDAPLN